MKKLLPLSMIFIAVSVMGTASCKKEKNDVVPTTTQTNTTNGTLTAYETESITHMREEEKVARDVYTNLLTKWNIGVFSNISASEQKHMDAMLTLLNTYNITDPVGNNEVGVFTNPDFQKLYNDLLAKGMASEVDAITVGLTIEDMDIYDLQQALKQVSKTDIQTVYGNLLRASKNHMREFHAQLQTRGGSYTPQYITQQEYNDIVNSPKEHGAQ